jgi:hypothetical protein
MADNTALLANIFQMVTTSLAQNKNVLNQADDQNHDHGTNMVQTFQTITKALNAKKNAPASTALAYASQKVSKESTSGSGQLYAQGLAQAATQMQGQTINPQSAVQILQALIGGGQAQPQAQSGNEDILGSILGGLTGAQPQQPQQQQQQQAQAGGGDLLGSILGGLAGGGTAQQGGSSDGLDIGDLINAGMTYMQAKQSGSSNAGALIQAIMSGSGMGNTNHRAQSTQLVTNSFLQALGSLAGNKGQ